ncbi:MAG: hypothetical protein C4523_21030 [Myxococcales bacterium]|nr:MAG: hypothetical protein C4523_21030 [Myxococcales bacterium]
MIVVKSFEVANVGATPLSLTGAAFTPTSSLAYGWKEEPAFPIILTPSQRVSFSVRLSPDLPGFHLGRIILTSSDTHVDRGGHQIDLESRYSGEAGIDCIPERYNFDSTPLGNQAGLEIICRHVLPAGIAGPIPARSVTIDRVSFSPGDSEHFIFPNLEGLLVTPETPLYFRVRYEPTSLGAHSLSAYFYYQGGYNPQNPAHPETPLELVFSGTGVESCLAASPGVLDFGDAPVGEEPQLEVRLTNRCASSFIVQKVEFEAVEDNPFRVINLPRLPLTLPIGEPWILQIGFHPAQGAVYENALLVFPYDTEVPHLSLPLEGRGIGGLVSFSERDIDFGEVLWGETAERELIVGNLGNAEVSILDVLLSEEDREKGFGLEQAAFPMPLPAGESRVFKLFFTSKGRSAEPVGGSLFFLTDEPEDNSQIITLSATPVFAAGTAICEISYLNQILPPSLEVDLGETSVGQENFATYYFLSLGNAPCQVESIGFEACSSSAFRFLPREIPPLPPSSSAPLHLSYAPFAPGRDDSAALLIRTNDLDPERQTIVFQLSGRSLAQSCLAVDPEEAGLTDHDFGRVPVGRCSSELPIRLSNRCDTEMTVPCSPEDVGWEGLNPEDLQIDDWRLDGPGACRLRRFSEETPDALSFTVKYCPQQIDETLAARARLLFSNPQASLHKLYFKGSSAQAACEAPIGGAPIAEICDGIDNDCSGGADEPYRIGYPCDGKGLCGLGVLECAGDYETHCSTDWGGSAWQGSSETCDRLDNDCDGNTDEDFDLYSPCAPDGPGAPAGYTQCAADGLGTICERPMTAIDLCDGMDNDQNGATDEGFSLGASCDGLGQCSAGVVECATPFTTRCSTDHDGSQYVGPAIERYCDGRDDDCDGRTDEDFHLGAPCLGRGSCKTGTLICKSNAAACSTDGGTAEPEFCDDIDNDCDGYTDETFTVGQVCQAPGNCGAGVFECKNAAAVRCSTGWGGSDWQGEFERCDGEDNDCDGEIDENFYDGRLCRGPGECGEGDWECADEFSAVCSTMPGGSEAEADEELVNGFDDDCNGFVDETSPPDDDPLNCGGCGIVCETPNALTACEDGECVIADCDSGWEDTNLEYDDGCETELP